MKTEVITIDGPAGSGKSTIAKLLARRLGAVFLDTGSMYRAVTYLAMSRDIDLADTEAVIGLVRQNDLQFNPGDDGMNVLINGADVSEHIRDPQVTAGVRHIAAQPRLREMLVRMQRDFAGTRKTVVTEGRDQGTVVFADARHKFFLTADVTERAARRARQLAENGKKVDLARLENDIIQRDRSDMTRTTGPLLKAADAVEIDTTDLSIEQVIDKMAAAIEGK